MSFDQPDWVCFDCAELCGHGAPEGHVCTVHIGICGVCGEKKAVTEPSDFRWLKPEWKSHKDDM